MSLVYLPETPELKKWQAIDQQIKEYKQLCKHLTTEEAKANIEFPHDKLIDLKVQRQVLFNSIMSGMADMGKRVSDFFDIPDNNENKSDAIFVFETIVNREIFDLIVKVRESDIVTQIKPEQIPELPEHDGEIMGRVFYHAMMVIKSVREAFNSVIMDLESEEKKRGSKTIVVS